ncbi:MAG: protein kinase [Myxococcota bacterium]
MIDRYEVEAEIGSGGMGRVFRARDTELQRRVALKLVDAEETSPESAERRARFAREARLAAAFSHPGAVTIFDVGLAGGQPYLAMELVEGRTLRDVLRGPSPPLAVRLRWLHQVATVLDAAHRERLVHRDIKPDNVMVTEDGAVKVLDFGIARRMRAPIDPAAPTETGGLGTLTQVGTPVGTPLYMAPEQIRGTAVDGKTDQFAWGVLAYELLSGRAPWSARDPLQLVAAILTDEPARLTGVPEAVAAVVTRAMAKDPTARFATMADVAAALEATERPSLPPAGPVRQSSGPPPRLVSATFDPAVAPAVSTLTQSFSLEEASHVAERALLRLHRDRLAPDGRPYWLDTFVRDLRRLGLEEGSANRLRHSLMTLRSAEELQAERWRQLKGRLLGWAVLTTFFFGINALDGLREVWFLYPSLCLGLAVGFSAIPWLNPPPLEPRPVKKRWFFEKGRQAEVDTAAMALVHAIIALPPEARGPVESRHAPAGGAQLSPSVVDWDARFAEHHPDRTHPQVRPRIAGPRIEDPSGAPEAEAEAEAEALVAAPREITPR